MCRRRLFGKSKTVLSRLKEKFTIGIISTSQTQRSSGQFGEVSHTRRKRSVYGGLFVATILCGLLSRSSLTQLPGFLTEFAGDTLWAMMVFWMFCCIKPSMSTRLMAFSALVFSFGIEFSQLYHAPWADAVRATKLGGLVLGFGFKASDLVCYTVGISMGAAIDFGTGLYWSKGMRVCRQ